MINNSVKKCVICNNEKCGEFITINEKKYHLCCIEQLQQENKKLKEELENTIFNFKSLSAGVGALAEYMGLDNDAIIEDMIYKAVKDKGEIEKLKTILSKVRKDDDLTIDEKITLEELER